MCYRLAYSLNKGPVHLHPKRFITSGEAIKAGERLQNQYGRQVSNIRFLNEYGSLPDNNILITQQGTRLIPHTLDKATYYTTK